MGTTTTTGVTTPKTVAKITFQKTSPTFDLTIVRPNLETVTFRGIHLPYPYSKILPLPAVRNTVDSALEKVAPGTSFSSSCMVDTGLLSSFDGKTLSLASMTSTCEHLVSADCSKFHRFAITTRYMKLVKIYLLKTVIEVVPTSSSAPKVLVNNQPVVLQAEEPISIVVSSSSSGINATLFQTVDGIVIIRCPQLMLNELRTDGKVIQVLPSPLLKNRLCGLCGDFNNQIQADIAGPSKCVYSKPELEVASYMVESSVCPLRQSHSPILDELEAENQQCAKVHVQPTKVAKAYKISTGKCTMLRHLTVRRAGELCISKVPVTQCGPSCKSERSSMVQKSVPFTCLPALGRLSDHYLRKASVGIIPELATETTSFSTMMTPHPLRPRPGRTNIFFFFIQRILNNHCYLSRTIENCTQTI